MFRLILIAIFCSSYLLAEDSCLPTDFYLSNGMRVILKEMDTEESVILMGLYANGGYASLPTDKLPSGRLSALTAWESGLGSLTTDQISVLLHDESIELGFDIQPFRRSIEAAASQESLPFVFKMINLIFTRPNFEKESFEKELNHTAESIQRRESDFETSFEEAFLLFNTRQFPPFKPLTIEALKQADFEESKKFFLESFSSPRDFVCVVIGPFDKSKLEEIIKNFLGSIPSKPPSKVFKPPILPPFPEGISKHIVPVSKRPVSATRMTFPLAIDINLENIKKIQLACELLESRLRKVMIQKTLSTRGIGVSYEFPYYPNLVSPWMIIQFQVEFERIDEMKFILDQIKTFQEELVSEEELQYGLELLRLEGESWRNHGEYWLAAYANDVLWGWNPAAQCFSASKQKITPEEIRALFKNMINLSNYTQISTQPMP